MKTILYITTAALCLYASGASGDAKANYTTINDAKLQKDTRTKNASGSSIISESCPRNIKSSFDADSFLMSNFGIGLRIHNKTGRVCKTRSRSNFVPWKIERKGNRFIFKGPSGYLGRKKSMYNDAATGYKGRDVEGRGDGPDLPDISRSIQDIVIGNAEEPTEWSVFVHLPDRRLLLTNDKDVLTFDRRCLSMSSDIKDAKLFTLANVSGLDEDEDDTEDLVATEDSESVI